MDRLLQDPWPEAAGSIAGRIKCSALCEVTMLPLSLGTTKVVPFKNEEWNLSYSFGMPSKFLREVKRRTSSGITKRIEKTVVSIPPTTTRASGC
jgi:hypothetical protein